MKKERPAFIKDKVSPVFYRMFYWYSLTLFRRRFRRVWIDDSVHPPGGTSVLFVGTHNSWWDGMIPLLMNEASFGLDARAIMDEQQLRRYPFFRYLGVYSINRDYPLRAMKSLEYTVRLLNNSTEEHPVGIWAYPEGKLVNPHKAVTLESGLAWLSRHIDPEKCEIIPFTSHMHTMRGDKPELFIKLGNPIGPKIYRSGHVLAHVTYTLEELRKSCRETSGNFDEDGYPQGGFRLLLGREPKAPEAPLPDPDEMTGDGQDAIKSDESDSSGQKETTTGSESDAATGESGVKRPEPKGMDDPSPAGSAADKAEPSGLDDSTKGNQGSR